MTFKEYSSSLLRYPDLGFSLDLSCMGIEPGFFNSMHAQIERAFDDAKYGQVSRRPYIDIIIPSMIDPR